jgi:hypothetical protein
VFQEVWYQNEDELAAARDSKDPFIVAVALAKDYGQHPHQFRSFQAIFEVVSTGRQLTRQSIETKVLRRVVNSDFTNPDGTRG